MITILRVVASFAIVGLLLWFFMRASNGKLGALLSGNAKGEAGNPLAVLDRRQLTKSAGIALVRAGNRHLLVGIGDHGVQLLAEGDDLTAGMSTSHSTDRITLDQVAVVRHDDVVSETPLTVVGARARNTTIADTASVAIEHIDQPGARTRLGRGTAPHPPRMSFVAALREMTVRRS
jgi:flagellar biogenesis protein FliO